MPEFAQFIAITQLDTAVTVDQGRVFTFDLPDLDAERTVVLMFKVSGGPDAGLKMALTSAGQAVPVRFRLDPTFTKPRSWHEVVQKGLFKAVDNRLVVEPDGGADHAIVSDLVVLYHAKTA